MRIKLEGQQKQDFLDNMSVKAELDKQIQMLAVQRGNAVRTIQYILSDACRQAMLNGEMPKEYPIPDFNTMNLRLTDDILSWEEDQDENI